MGKPSAKEFDSGLPSFVMRFNAAGDVSSEWERMNAQLKKHLEQSGADDGIFADSGAGGEWLRQSCHGPPHVTA